MSEYKFTPTDEHPTIANYVWYELWRFCGCGDSAAVLAHVRDTLRAMEKRRAYFDAQRFPAVLHWSPEDQAVVDAEADAIGAGDRNSLVYYMTSYMLDAAGLTDHGTSIPGWPTPLGLALLKYLENTPAEEWLA